MYVWSISVYAHSPQCPSTTSSTAKADSLLNAPAAIYEPTNNPSKIYRPLFSSSSNVLSERSTRFVADSAGRLSIRSDARGIGEKEAGKPRSSRMSAHRPGCLSFLDGSETEEADSSGGERE